jgi:cyclic di-GMP phosphodiesterase
MSQQVTLLDKKPAPSQDEPAPAGVQAARIMVVDDEVTNVKVVCRLLKLEGYSSFLTTTDAREAVELARTQLPDLILLDLNMPHVSGLEILSELQACESTRFIPVVILTASTDKETRVDALDRGANEFLNKPVDPSELAPRVRNVLSLKSYQDQLRNYSRDLEAAVRERTTELEASRQDVIHCLARAAEYRDDDTGQHVLRVGKYTRLVAEELGVAGKELDTLEQAAQLHDVGKIGIPDALLLKPGKLTEQESHLMQKHCGFGKRILQCWTPEEENIFKSHANIGAKILELGHSPILEIAVRIALTHHEWWDGSGYPLGLQGEDIPLEGRVTAVADVFDALSTKRCYKEAFPLEKCFQIMEEERGTHFDPTVLDAFFKRRHEIVTVQLRYADEK